VQITGMLIFLFVWLFILWLGSIALEATGMEREKARFQALSALSGTGFTTREAESIVNHPRRRRIVSWLIFLGSVGIIAFILVMILYLRAGFKAPTLVHIGIIIISIFILGLIVWTGLINKLSNIIVSLLHKGHPVSDFNTEEILHQVGDYGIARIRINERNGATSFTLGNKKFKEQDITILAIERGDKVLSLPKDEEVVLAGDRLLCYGKVSGISGLNNI
jgi:amino acid transporter